MNDPWDVKCVRQGHQYQSLMKINGVPLLPPVLSKECRKEMQYYKLLAKEVEKRIMILRPYVDSGSESEEKLHAILPSEQNTLMEHKKQIKEVAKSDITLARVSSDRYSPTTSFEDTSVNDASDSEQDMYGSGKEIIQLKDIPVEVPERDCDYSPKAAKEILTDTDRNSAHQDKTKKDFIDDVIHFNVDETDDDYIPLKTEGPSSLSSKSFTGSLRDLHTETHKEALPLVRQHSYTVLNPSPQLLAHLEIQSLCTGVELTSISMSESAKKQNRKRRSWDLESAKIKWSNMAQELQKTNVRRHPSPKREIPPCPPSTIGYICPENKNRPNNGKLNSLTEDKNKKPNGNAKSPKSEPIGRPKSPMRSPCGREREKTVERIQNKEPTSPISKTVVKMSTQRSPYQKKQDKAKPTLVSNANDRATRVKELYEKLQKQQLMQMTSLMEKQKREQEMLQKVFEEQNNILLKQLKTVCPTAPIEIKQAWGDLKDDTNRGPVSLSQLINNNSPDLNISVSPVTKTLTETNIYMNRCDKVLKTSRDITNSIKKSPQKRSLSQRSQKSDPVQVIPPSPEGKARQHSPTVRHISRKLNYDTSNSSENGSNYDFEPMLTDRTNDTMADLNVTFPSDSDEIHSPMNVVYNVRKLTATRACSPQQKPYQNLPCTDTAIRNLEDTIQNSMKTFSGRNLGKPRLFVQEKTTEQQRQAATKIVAYAKGYLVRRLMRTERVQAIVQTIQDALVCALELHQDREGIRGADVDLHRRLIQQITAACYTLHDTFVSNTPSERCSIIAADRARKQALAVRPPNTPRVKRTDIMSQSHSGAFPARAHRKPSSIMTQSNYETFSGEKTRPAYMPNPRRRPWRC